MFPFIVEQYRIKSYEQNLLRRFYADRSAYGTQDETNGTNIVPGIKPT